MKLLNNPLYMVSVPIYVVPGWMIAEFSSIFAGRAGTHPENSMSTAIKTTSTEKFFLSTGKPPFYSIIFPFESK